MTNTRDRATGNGALRRIYHVQEKPGAWCGTPHPPKGEDPSSTCRRRSRQNPTACAMRVPAERSAGRVRHSRLRAPSHGCQRDLHGRDEQAPAFETSQRARRSTSSRRRSGAPPGGGGGAQLCPCDDRGLSDWTHHFMATLNATLTPLAITDCCLTLRNYATLADCRCRSIRARSDERGGGGRGAPSVNRPLGRYGDIGVASTRSDRCGTFNISIMLRPSTRARFRIVALPSP